MAQWEADDNRTALENKVEEIRLQAVKQAKTIEFYTTNTLKKVEELQRNALELYKENETGIAELLQGLASARDIRKAYLEAIHDYNVTMIELELYTE